MTADPGPISVELAQEAPFRLGALEVRPATGELLWPEGRDLLQPRVMQVLVALAARRGEVVSRDELTQACWGGRAVGDDALNRCIAELRRRAEATQAFRLETFPRVGYRLTALGDPPPAARRRLPRWAQGAIAAGLLAALGLGAFGAWAWRDRTPPTPRITVEALRAPGGNPAASAAASDLGAEIAGALSEAGLPVSAAERAPAAPRGAMTLGGVVTRDGGQLRARLFLEDRAAHVILWSRDYAWPLADVARQRIVAASDVTEAIYAAIEARQQKGLALDAETVALHVRAAEAMRNPTALRRGEARRAVEQVLAREPRAAADRGMLALTLSIEAAEASGPARAALLQRAEREAAQAIRVDPAAAGAAWDARQAVQRLRAPTDFVAADDRIVEGLRNAPDFPFLHMRRCRLLTDLGRAREAVAFCDRAAALLPVGGPIGFSRARALQGAGRPDLAAEAIRQAAARRPDHNITRIVRFELAAFDGSAAEARALLHDPATRPVMEPGVAPALDAFLEARLTRRAEDAERAEALLTSPDAGGLGWMAPRALARLGRTDAAFTLMNGPGFAAMLGDGGPAFLSQSGGRALRADPRFWPLVARLGLARYWLERDAWPDFCGADVTLDDCRRLARAAVASAR
jgi:tetratricopeptide (TPR) repeat protein